MKSLTLFSFLFLFFFCQLMQAQEIKISPIPQKITFEGSWLPIPVSYTIEGLNDADSVAAELLQTVFSKPVHKSDFKIIIGEKGDKSIKAFSKNIPDTEEGYFLQVTSKGIVLAGNDFRGTFYAVQTLLQLLKEDKLPEVVIQDYPDIRFRGVVEGFYGTPWSFEDRLRQLDFYGQNKLNTYIYGPKDDPYHSSPHWREPYPEDEADKIRQLAIASLKNRVDFVWAIHPGKDIQWTDSDRNALLNKFENMYQLGVRSFAVFFDDISGVGTDPQKQVELLNYLDDQFISKKGNVTPLIMCPTEYNKSWSNLEKGYLKTLGNTLNPTIHIMWTGDRVIAEITEGSVHWINKQINRPAFIWWNFPVSDYVRDHLLMGRVYGNDTTIGDKVSGFVTNPMERAEASKIAVFSVADYAWNTKSFDSPVSWENAIQSLMPLSYKALHKFSQHNSDLGQNSHGFRREESVDILPVVTGIQDVLIQNQLPDTQLLNHKLRLMKKEFEEIIESADFLLASNDNEILVKEIKPWIYQFKNLGETGLQTIKLYEAFAGEDKINFLNSYNHIHALRKINYLIDKSYNQNPYQPGVKTGSLVLQPFIDQLFSYTVINYNKQVGDSLNSVLSYIPVKFSGTVSQLKGLPLHSKKANQISIPPVLEVVQWDRGEYLELEFDEPCVFNELMVDMDYNKTDSWLSIEVSENKKEWNPVEVKFEKNRIKIIFDKTKLKYLRLINKEKHIDMNFKGLALSYKVNK